MPQYQVPVINGTITVGAGQRRVNYIGLSSLGFEKVSADDWQLSIKYYDWADYRALLENMSGCGVEKYSYNPASFLNRNRMEHSSGIA